MKDIKTIFNFLIEVNKLKGKKRRGWVIHKIKNPETTIEHIFSLTMLVWFLGKMKRINLERAIKMALIHDVCEIYSPDFTSFDAKGLKEKGKTTVKELLKVQPKFGRPTTNQRKKMEKIKQALEIRAIKKLISKLPPVFKKEIEDLWLDYEKGLSKEGRFVKQADKMINFMQGMEYWKKYGRIQHKLWRQRIKEVIDDPILLNFLQEVEKKFH
jgi:putative hydrolase of HD superfamily